MLIKDGNRRLSGGVRELLQAGQPSICPLQKGRGRTKQTRVFSREWRGAPSNEGPAVSNSLQTINIVVVRHIEPLIQVEPRSLAQRRCKTRLSFLRACNSKPAQATLNLRARNTKPCMQVLSILPRGPSCRLLTLGGSGGDRAVPNIASRLKTHWAV